MRDRLLPTRTRAQIAADNRAELDAWIDERTEQLIARGLDATEARRRALDEFGDVALAERYAEHEDVTADRRARVTLWIEELASDLRIAARTLARTPTVTAVVLLTFALGIGATTAVFSIVHAVLLRRLPYDNERTLVYLQPLDKGVVGPNPRHSSAAVAALQAGTTSFTAIAAVGTGSYIIADGGDPEQIRGAALSPNGFDVLQSSPAIGRTFGTAEKTEPGSHVVILLDGLWRRRFGADSSVVGRTIELSNERYQVIGVMPPAFRIPTHEDGQFIRPLDMSDLLANADRKAVRVWRLLGRLKPNVSLAVAQADVNRTMQSLQRESPKLYGDIEARVVPIRTAVAGDARLRLLVLMGAAALVLLIACANVAGILLARAMARRHELAVRVALGAGRGRLVRQFMAEGVVLAAAGAAFGLAVAHLGVLGLRSIATTALPEGTTFALEPRVLSFAIAAAVVGALASSLVPALGATRIGGSVLRRDEARASLSRASRRVRIGLVAGQLAVSLVLLVGAGLFVRTLQQLAALDLGYSTDHALTFRPQFTHPKSDAEQDAYYETLYGQLRAIPGVISVGGGNIPTGGQSTVSGLAIEGRAVESGRLPDVRYSVASDDYFATLGIPVVRGRVFTPDDRTGAPYVAVVSERVARQLWPGGEPIGARVRPDPEKPWATVVGVVGDVRMGGEGDPQSFVYTSQRQDHWPAGGTIVIRAQGDPLALAASVRQVVRRIDPTLVITGMRTLDEFRRNTPAIADRRLQMQLTSVFALVALAVSAIGVYGACAYATEARRLEFGIRMALGASQRGVLWLVLRDAAYVAMIGALIGIPLALGLAVRVGDLLYGVGPFDPLTVGAVLGTLVIVVVSASLVPARRATLIDPVKTMRTD
jgi:putative ABC transport system permease protein